MRTLTFLFLFFSCWIVFVYVSKKRFSYYSLIVFCIFFASRAIFLKINIVETAVIIGMTVLATLSVEGCKILFENSKTKIEKEIEKKRGAFHIIEKENNHVLERRNFLDERSFVFSKIYELFKKMSEALKIEEIINMLSIFLNENFQFHNALFVILTQGSNLEEIKKVYKIKKGEEGFGEVSFLDIEKWESKLIEALESERTTKIMKEGDELFHKFGIDNSIEEAILIPLIVEEKLIAIVMMENLKREQFEYFSILASQLAPEFKKVSLYESVERLSIMDSLTEIYLRRYFIDRLNEEIKRSTRLKLKFSVLMVDIDHFKRCNDAYGHMVGDAVLRELASIIKNNVREIDLVARYGGEEFTLILPETKKEDSFYVAERIRKAVENQTIRAYDESLNLTVSIGISVYPEDGTTPWSLIEKADEAMYQSKQKGRNQVSIWRGNG